ncbi:MAG: cation:proton antiporter [Alphaproteobacteria bacterium]|nr:cation:proton antiporter [Alphaproteobacteria bacterium]
MDTSPLHHFPELLILLGVAGLTVPFLHKLKISPILGYLFCGIVVGPYGLGLLSADMPWIGVLTVQDTEAVAVFAELGVIFLMFMIGLELSLGEIWRMRHHVLGIGSLQLGLTSIAIFAIARMFGNAVEISILLGVCFSLSSTAVVMQLLEEKGKMKDPPGRLCFSILLMQDMAVVPLLTLLTAFAARTDQSLWLVSGKALLMAVGSIVVIYIAGMKVLKPVLRYADPARNREWLMSFVMFLVIGTSALTSSLGLSAALGAFLAGLLLTETECREEVRDIISPVKGILMGMFFMSVGMMIDVREVLRDPFWLIASVCGIGALKAAILFLSATVFRVGKQTAVEAAIMLGQGGEFVFVIVTMALSYKIIAPADAQFFMLVTALSLTVTPFIAPLAPKIAQVVGRSKY